ncbi:MAG: BTAD domain-containing putative transcriptional regulator [Candidatus Dormibacteria bacterium]
MSRALRFGVLGALRVEADGQQLALGPTRQRALLAALLLNRNQLLTRERILTMLWDSPPGSARHSIEVYISGIRQVIEEPGKPRRLAGSRDGYTLHVLEHELDLGEFSLLHERAGTLVASGDVPAAQDELSRALALWRGEPLAGLRSFSFIDAEAVRLERRRLDATVQSLDLKLRLGVTGPLRAEIDGLVGQFPLSEPLGALQVRAAAAAGDRGEAVNAFYRLRRDLFDALGLEPSAATQQLLRGVLSGEPTSAAQQHIPSNLPRFDDLFVGRSAELRVVRSLALARRLVTLTGLAGVGKTRLAVEAAAELKAEFGDGIWFVSLRDVEAISRLYPAVARAIGLQEQSAASLEDVVTQFLATRRALLILDNCEYLQPGLGAFIQQLIRRCPNLSVLATTLEPLGIRGEHEWRVEPLPIPGSAEPRGFMESESVALFRDRAAAFMPDIGLSSADFDTMERITRHLGGLPLAIELTAPRLRDMSIAALAEALGGETDTTAIALTGRPERHRSLDRAIAASWERLPGQARRTLEAASLFVGGVEPGALARVAGDETRGGRPTADLVVTLEERALVRVEPDEFQRISMLDAVRRFAARRLEGEPHSAAFLNRYIDAIADLAIEAGSQLEGGGMLRAVDLLSREFDNVQTCLRLLISRGDAQRALVISGSLTRFWWCRGHLSDGRAWLREALSLPGGAGVARVEALHQLGFLEWHSGMTETALDLCRASVELARELGEVLPLVRSLHHLGVAHYEAGNFKDSVHTLGEAVRLAETAGDGHQHGLVLDQLGRGLFMTEGMEAAYPRHQEALHLLSASGDLYGESVCLINLAEACIWLGKHKDARGYYWRAFGNWRQMGSQIGTAFSVYGLATLAYSVDDAECAGALLSATESLWEAVGAVFLSEAERIAAIRQAVSDKLGARAAEECQAVGRRAPWRPDFAAWVSATAAIA